MTEEEKKRKIAALRRAGITSLNGDDNQADDTQDTLESIHSVFSVVKIVETMGEGKELVEKWRATTARKNVLLLEILTKWKAIRDNYPGESGLPAARRYLAQTADGKEIVDELERNGEEWSKLLGEIFDLYRSTR